MECNSVSWEIHRIKLYVMENICDKYILIFGKCLRKVCIWDKNGTSLFKNSWARLRNFNVFKFLIIGIQFEVDEGITVFIML